MKLARSLLPVFLICTSLSSLFAIEMEFLFHKENVPENIKLNSYYALHNLNFKLLRPLGIRLDEDEMAKLILVVSGSASSKNPNLIVFKKYKQNQDLRLVYRYFIKDNKIALVFFSNYEIESNTFIEKSTGKEFAVMFNIAYDRMIYFHNVFNEEKEKELIGKNQKLSLANFYLFDDKPDNDNKSKELLDEIIDDTKSTATERLVAKLTVGQIALINYQLKGSESIALKVEPDIKKISDKTERETVEFIYKIYLYEINVMNRLLSSLQQ